MTKIQDEFRALYDNQKLLAVLIFSMVTVLVWVGGSLIRSQRKSSISPELTQLALPLNPSINAEILTEIEQKREFTSSELSTFPIYVIRDRDAAAKTSLPAASSLPLPTSLSTTSPGLQETEVPTPPITTQPDPLPSSPLPTAPPEI